MPTIASAPISHVDGETGHGHSDLPPLTHSHKGFDELYARMRANLRRYFYKTLPHDQDSEDWTHDIFLRYLTVTGKGQEIHKPEHWIWKTAHNLVMDFFRHRNVLLARNPNWTNPIPIQTFDTPDNKTLLPIVTKNLEPVIECTFPLLIANVDALMAALPHLNKAQLEVLRLRYADDMLFKEIATHLDISFETAKARHHRAIVHLRKLMEPES